MIEILIASLLSALLSGGFGYAVAMVRRDTKVALLEREHILLKEHTERNDARLSLVLRLVVDIAQKSGVEVRTTDLLEIAALSPQEYRT